MPTENQQMPASEHKELHTDTEYYESDDNYSMEIDSGDKTRHTMRRKKPDRIIYDSSVKMSAFIVGMVFEIA